MDLGKPLGGASTQCWGGSRVGVRWQRSVPLLRLLSISTRLQGAMGVGFQSGVSSGWVGEVADEAWPGMVR